MFDNTIDAGEFINGNRTFTKILQKFTKNLSQSIDNIKIIVEKGRKTFLGQSKNGGNK